MSRVTCHVSRNVTQGRVSGDATEARSGRDSSQSAEVCMYTVYFICSADEYKMLSILARQTFYLICYLPSAMTGNYQLQTCYNILLVFSVSLLSLHRVCVRSVKVCPDDVTTLRRISPPHTCLQMWFWDMATCGKQIKIKYIILFLSEKSLLMVKR